MLSNSTEIKQSLKTNRAILLTGAISALLQLVVLIEMAAALAALGPKLVGAEDYFRAYAVSPIEMVLRSEFFIMVLIALYLTTFPALYIALKEISPFWAGAAVAGSLITAVLAISSDTTFSMMHLAEQYMHAAGDEANQLLAAGHAVFAQDLWHNSAGYMSGILLQGGGVIISLVMLRSKDFSKVTAIAGLVGNGLDLIQHILHPWAPSLQTSLAPIMGTFYIIWYPMLAWDLFKNYRKLGVSFD